MKGVAESQSAPGLAIVRRMNFRGLGKGICGLDPDERVLHNAHLDEAKVGFGESIGWPDATIDIVIADSVLKHLAEPVKVFAEISRVLKPGGMLLFETPNRSHYVPLIARRTSFTSSTTSCAGATVTTRLPLTSAPSGLRTSAKQVRARACIWSTLI